MIEAIGEYFIEQRFITNCSEVNRFFSAARVERFTRGPFPRILLDPSVIDQPIPIDQIQADLLHLGLVIRSNPESIAELMGLLNDPEAFGAKARTLRLTEADFVNANGGALWFLVLVVAAVVLTGCPPPAGPARCNAPHPTAGVNCTRLPHGPGPGGTGGHINPLGLGHRW
jgi:hypothetical protein